MKFWSFRALFINSKLNLRQPIFNERQYEEGGIPHSRGYDPTRT